MRWGRFLLFCAGVALLGAVVVLLTGHGLLVRETHPSLSAEFRCDYLTIRGMVSKDFNRGGMFMGRWDCPLVIDPSRATF